MTVLIGVAFFFFLIYLYIKFWSWVGGKIGGFIGRLIDGCSDHRDRQ